MIIYHVMIGSEFVFPQKWLFKCRCKAVEYIESIKRNLPFIDADKQKQWEELKEDKRQLALEHLYVLTAIDTKRCKKWQKLFYADFYREKV
jgi:hypothetical protein